MVPPLKCHEFNCNQSQCQVNCTANKDTCQRRGRTAMVSGVCRRLSTTTTMTTMRRWQDDSHWPLRFHQRGLNAKTHQGIYLCGDILQHKLYLMSPKRHALLETIQTSWTNDPALSKGARKRRGCAPIVLVRALSMLLSHFRGGWVSASTLSSGSKQATPLWMVTKKGIKFSSKHRKRNYFLIDLPNQFFQRELSAGEMSLSLLAGQVWSALMN